MLACEIFVLTSLQLSYIHNIGFTFPLQIPSNSEIKVGKNCLISHQIFSHANSTLLSKMVSHLAQHDDQGA